MRVVTYLTEGYRELIEEMKRVPAKQRSERFRLLASIGLLTLRGTWGASTPPATRGQTEQLSNKPPFESRRTKLRDKLQRSLSDDANKT